MVPENQLTPQVASLASECGEFLSRATAERSVHTPARRAHEQLKHYDRSHRTLQDACDPRGRLEESINRASAADPVLDVLIQTGGSHTSPYDPRPSRVLYQPLRAYCEILNRLVRAERSAVTTESLAEDALDRLSIDPEDRQEAA